jgi:hypothetical protein
MAMITQQCSQLMREDERIAAREETEHWFFNGTAELSAAEQALLREIRQKIDPLKQMGLEALAQHLSGSLELVFSLSAHVLEKLIADVRAHQIGVSVSILMSPNAAVFAGNALEMARFHQLFTGARKIELKRVTVESKGTPHYHRLARSAGHVADLLKIYEQQGRLRDPVIPLVSCTGEVVRTGREFIAAVSGVADQPLCYDRMIEEALDQGGRHFALIQSGMSSSAGDLFDAVIRHHANAKGIKSVTIHHPALRTPQPHPVCAFLEQRPGTAVPDALNQSLTDTTGWYERLLSAIPDTGRGD